MKQIRATFTISNRDRYAPKDVEKLLWKRISSDTRHLMNSKKGQGMNIKTFKLAADFKKFMKNKTYTSK